MSAETGVPITYMSSWVRTVFGQIGLYLRPEYDAYQEPYIAISTLKAKEYTINSDLNEWLDALKQYIDPNHLASFQSFVYKEFNRIRD